MSHFIMESAIFQEAEVVKSNPSRAIFRIVLQTVDEVNQNRRLYPKKVLAEGMVSNSDIIKSRAFTGEMDHPFPTGNDSVDAVRQSTVSLKEISHLIRDYEFDGNKLIGELETAGPHGDKLLKLLRERVGIGISMRGMAELDRQSEMNVVKSPLMVITFDTVSRPSHKAAVVNFSEMRFESMSLLKESSCNSTICTSDGRCYLTNYFDKLVESKIIQFTSKWI